MGRRRSSARKRPVTATAPLGVALERVTSGPAVAAVGGTAAAADVGSAGKAKKRGGPVAAAHAAAARGGKGQRAKAHAALIAGFHALNKRLAAARLRGDDKTASELEAEIAALGGLERYQEASVRGEKLKGGTTNTAQWLVRAAHMHAYMADHHEATALCRACHEWGCRLSGLANIGQMVAKAGHCPLLWVCVSPLCQACVSCATGHSTFAVQ